MNTPSHIAVSYNDFIALAKQGNLIPVYKELPADLITPLAAYRKVSAGKPSYLLESFETFARLGAADSRWWGQFSYIGVNPVTLYQGRKQFLDIMTNGLQTQTKLPDTVENFLRAERSKYRPVHIPSLPRFWSGMVGFLGFSPNESSSLNQTNQTFQDLDLPDFAFMVAENHIIFDHLQKKMLVIANAFIPDHETVDFADIYNKAVESIDELTNALNRQSPEDVQVFESTLETSGLFTYAIDIQETKNLVIQTQHFMQENDIEVINLIKLASADLPAAPFNVYRSLRKTFPSYNLFYLDFGKFTIAGSSSEVLYRVAEHVIQSRFVLSDKEKDAVDYSRPPNQRLSTARQAILNAKKSAMEQLVDSSTLQFHEATPQTNPGLLGSVAEFSGTFRRELDSFNAFTLLVPSETVSGVPKKMALNLISKLEDTPRGPFGGCVGYIGFDGNTELCTLVDGIVMSSHKAIVALPLEVTTGVNLDSIQLINRLDTFSKILEEATTL